MSAGVDSILLRREPLAMRVLRHPLTVLLGALLGVTVAVLWPGTPAISVLSAAGRWYLLALGMTALPIICTGVIAGLGALVRLGFAGRTLPLMAVGFVGVALAAALVGTLVGLAGMPGSGDTGALRHHLGELVQSGAGAGAGSGGRGSVAGNIFAALANGEVMPVVAACILVGLALGPIRHRAADGVIAAMSVLNTALLRIVNWIMLALPLGLCGVAAGMVGGLGAGTLEVLLRLLALFYAGGAVVVLGMLLAIRYGTRASWRELHRHLLRPMHVAFLSSSGVTAMPLAIQAMSDGLRCDRRLAGLVVPLGLTSGRASFPLLFALVAVFSAQIYGVEPSLTAILGMSVAAALVGMVTAAGSPAASAVLFVPVAAVLDLPAQLGIAAIIALSILLDPLITLLNVLGPCACTALLQRSSPFPPELEETADL